MSPMNFSSSRKRPLSLIEDDDLYVMWNELARLNKSSILEDGMLREFIVYWSNLHDTGFDLPHGIRTFTEELAIRWADAYSQRINS